MSTTSTRYVRLRDRAVDLPKLRAALPAGAGVQDDPSSPFVAITMPTTTLEPEDLADWSRDFGEVIALQTQTVADLVVYDRWEGGARKRGLTYAGEAGWTRVTGDPETWEAKAFFSDAKLAELIEELEVELSDEATLERETNEAKRLWEAKRLSEGSTRPHADIAVMKRTIQSAYSLPTMASSAGHSVVARAAKKT
jgi:hypothetical protein